jgi:hypothetical protein
VTELSFLVDLLLNHKLPRPTREAVAQRIKEVEEALASQPQSFPRTAVQAAAVAQHQASLPPEIAKQAPSMQALMLKHPDLVPKGTSPLAQGLERALNEAIQFAAADKPEPQPVAVVAQTPAAAAAMASRNQAIAESLAGKIDKTTGRPRKF